MAYPDNNGVQMSKGSTRTCCMLHTLLIYYGQPLAFQFAEHLQDYSVAYGTAHTALKFYLASTGPDLDRSMEPVRSVYLASSSDNHNHRVHSWQTELALLHAMSGDRSRKNITHLSG